MLKQFLETFRKPSAALLARRELEEAQRQLLQAQSSAEFANGIILYRKTQITRLQKYIYETSLAENI